MCEWDSLYEIVFFWGGFGFFFFWGGDYNFLTHLIIQSADVIKRPNIKFHTALQWLGDYINQILYSQKTPHTPPLRASYGCVSCEDFRENWPHYNGTALYMSHTGWERYPAELTGTTRIMGLSSPWVYMGHSSSLPEEILWIKWSPIG